jgi:uncharacterized protein YqjF (DUF2071 family)
MIRKIDRITPTLRPPDRTVMYQGWRHLLFLHWIVPSEVLVPMLPPGLTVDTFEGNAYVGLVPFTMVGVRPAWFPRFPPITDFHETNVRTYVHKDGANPGVWFLSLDAANALAVRVARAQWRLPYHYSRMEMKHDGEWIDYGVDRLWPPPTPARLRVRYRPVGPVSPAEPGTLEHFLAERYLLYAYRDGLLYRGQVHHAPYPLQPAEAADLDETLLAASNIQRPEGLPLVHYARGVDVRIFSLRRI